MEVVVEIALFCRERNHTFFFYIRMRRIRKRVVVTNRNVCTSPCTNILKTTRRRYKNCRAVTTVADEIGLYEITHECIIREKRKKVRGKKETE